jgi:hypothetical protein
MQMNTKTMPHLITARIRWAVFFFRFFRISDLVFFTGHGFLK